MQPPLVLAFGFANATLLYGLGAASVPLILHLLNRRKHREVAWAAMRFLIAAVRKNSRRIRLEQWLLLAVRTLIILLVVTAMAKPFLEQGAIPVLAGQRTHRVLVLDASLSMASADGEVTRFDQAKALGARLVTDARRGDSVSLILMGDPPRVVVGDPSPNREEVLKELKEVSQTHGATDLAASFEAIDRVLAVSPIEQKEVVFLTDLQTASWRPAEGGRDEALKRALARVQARHPRSVVIDLGTAAGGNRAVTGLALTSPIVTAGTPALVRATLHNFGPGAADAVRVRLALDGNLGPEQVVDLPAGEDVPVVFNVSFATPGDHAIEVRIDPDRLKPDDSRWLAVPVRERVSVLLVDGHFKSEAFQAETDYLAQALSPESTSEGSPSVIKTEVIPEGQLARHDLAPYDTVALCNIAQFTEAEVAALDDYLKLGGGVVVFGGDQVVPDNYNRLLYADGKGLLPAALVEAVGDAAKKEAGFGFNALGFRHAIVEPFAGESQKVTSGLTSTKTWKYHRLKLPAGSPAKVALAFEGGDPAVIEVPRYQGTVIQVATTADAGWTTWPLHPSFPPVMERIVLQAAAGRVSERNVRVGQPLDQSFAAAGEAAPVTVELPGGKTVAAKLQAAGTLSRLHFEDTELSGPYQVKVGPPLSSVQTFAASPPPQESEPAKLDKAGLTAAFPGWPFAYMTNWQELTGDAGSVSRRGEFHRSLLYALLAFLLIESLLAWRFGHHATPA